MKTVVILFLYLVSMPSQLQSQQTETPFWRGIYTFGSSSQQGFQWMKDSLSLNVVQGSTGYGNATGDDALLNNQAGLKVINQVGLLDTLSRAQRMEYEAEQDSNVGPVKNYFAERTGRVPPGENTTWQIRAGVDPTGYMVKSAVPDDQYHYNQTAYVATFRMKAEYDQQAIPTTYVARITVWCKGHAQAIKESILTVSMFPDSAWRDFVLPFTLTSPHLCIGAGQSLTGGLTHSLGTTACSNVDLRVWWYGNHTAYLDKVIVEDTLAHSLFSGVYDMRIKQDAANLASYGLHEAFYLVDEPFTSANLGFNYVGNRIKDTVGQTDPRARRVTAAAGNLPRFLAEGQPSKLMIDPYVFISFLPHPSITDSATAARSGIEPWNYGVYSSTLQNWIDFLLSNGGLRSSAQLANDTLPLILIPQLHGIIHQSTGKYRTLDTNYYGSTHDLRPPSASELRLIYNMGMAYGAKGFMPFWYPTVEVFFSTDNVVFPGLVAKGSNTDHSSNEEVIYGNNIWTGYKEKWNEMALLNARLAHIGDTLLALTWKSAKSWTGSPNSPHQTPGWTGIVDTVRTKDTLANPTTDQQPYVEVGHLKKGATDYIVVVNRRCSTRQTAGEYDTRDIALTLNDGTGSLLVTDVETNRAWVTKGNGKFTDRFQPGEGKIYRLQSATVGGTQTFNQLKFIGGAVLTLASSANITARGNMDTVNVVLGSNAIFKADTGSTMVINRDSAFVFGSGSQLEIAGLLRTKYGNYTTVPSGATLKLHPDAALELGTYGRLFIEGTLSAIGTSNNPIIITKASDEPPYEASYGGIYLSSGSVDTLQYCRFTDLYTAVAIDFCNARICNNEFINCTIAISSDAYKQSPVIEDNIIDSCRIGLDVFTSSTIGTPLIQRNTVMACTYGIIINPSYKSILNDNHVFNGHAGILVSNASPVLHGNIVENSDSIGVLVIENADPRFGDYIKNDLNPGIRTRS